MRSVLGGKARRGVEFKMFQRKLKDSGATEPGAIAAQLQSSLADSATVHRRLDNLLSGTTQVRHKGVPLHASMALQEKCASGALCIVLLIGMEP